MGHDQKSYRSDDSNCLFQTLLSNARFLLIASGKVKYVHQMILMFNWVSYLVSISNGKGRAMRMKASMNGRGGVLFSVEKFTICSFVF